MTWHRQAAGEMAERLEYLRKLTTKPVEYGTVEYDNVRSELANSVPELLDLLEAFARLAVAIAGTE